MLNEDSIKNDYIQKIKKLRKFGKENSKEYNGMIYKIIDNYDLIKGNDNNCLEKLYVILNQNTENGFLLAKNLVKKCIEKARE